MKLSKHIILWSTLSLISIAVFTVLAAVDTKGRGKTNRSFQKHASHPVKITGVVYQAWQSGQILLKVRADTFTIGPRKFWAFNIRPFNEAVLTKAAIELNLPEDGESKEQLSMSSLLSPYTADLLEGTQSTGIVTRGVVEELNVTILKKNKKIFDLKAERADVDFKKNQARLKSASFEDPATNSRLTASLIVWDGQGDSFVIPGEYFFRKGRSGEIGKGRGLKLDFDWDSGFADRIWSKGQ